MTIDKAEVRPAEVDPVGRTEPVWNQHVVPTVSVVICTRDRPDTIERAVESVAVQPVSDFEVLVVDQSKSDETRAIVERMMRRFPHVRYLHLLKAGLSRAYNEGIRQTRGEFLAFTDDDCVAPPTWLPTIQHTLTQDPDVALLYGQVALPPELQGQIIDGIIPALYFSQRQRLSQRDGFRVFGMGANFAARRSMWDRIGGFDEVLGGGGPLKSSQDFDFAFRVVRAGGTILLEPDVTVYHYGLRSYAQWSATLSAYGVGDGGFYLKHIRAGDLYAGRLLARNVIMITGRELFHLLRGRGAEWSYLRGIGDGMKRSLRYKVNRRQRLYIMSHEY